MYEAVARTPTAELDAPVRRLSDAANYSRLWLGTAAAIALVGGSRGRRAALEGVLAIGVTSATVNLGVKPLARRRRPDRVGPDLVAARDVPMPGSASFPSGHAASAFAFAYAVGRHLPGLGPADPAARGWGGLLSRPHRRALPRRRRDRLHPRSRNSSHGGCGMRPPPAARAGTAPPPACRRPEHLTSAAPRRLQAGAAATRGCRLGPVTNDAGAFGGRDAGPAFKATTSGRRSRTESGRTRSCERARQRRNGPPEGCVGTPVTVGSPAGRTAAAASRMAVLEGMGRPSCHSGHRLVADLARDTRQRGRRSWQSPGSRLAAERRSVVAEQQLRPVLAQSKEEAWTSPHESTSSSSASRRPRRRCRLPPPSPVTSSGSESTRPSRTPRTPSSGHSNGPTRPPTAHAASWRR